MSSSDQYWLQQVSANLIMECVEAGWLMRENGGVSKEGLIEYADCGSSYAHRALKIATQFKMMTQNGDRYLTVERLGIIENISEEDYSPLFGRYLPNFKPFITFISILAKGGKPSDASRKIKVIYGLSASSDVIRRTIISWGVYAGVLEENQDGSIIIKIETDKLEAEAIRKLLVAMQNEIRAHMYLNTKLGEELYASLSTEDTEFLVTSIRNYETNPRKSIEDGMKVFENFLRNTLIKKGINASKCTGISSLLIELSKNNLILSKQTTLGHGMGALRNAAAHSNDKETGKPWIFYADTAIETILLTMSLSRSIFKLINENIQCI